MRAVPFHLQGKGVLDLDVAAEISALVKGKRKREESCGSIEPTSVLERRRSPSPPTSTSALSTSLGGSSGSIDTSGVAAVSENPLHKWTPSQEGCSASDAGRKEEWALDLQPIPDALEVGNAGVRCSAGGGYGLGMEDWDSMLPESAALQGNDQSFFRWFMGDMDDPSLKHLLQSGGSSEFESGGNGFGVVDSGLGFGGVSAPETVNVSAMNLPLSDVAASSGSDFALNSNSSSDRLLVSSQNQAPLSNFKGSFFGGSNSSSNPSNPIFSSSGNNRHATLPVNLLQVPFYQQQQMETIDEKPQLLNPQVLLNHHLVQSLQNPVPPLPFSYTQQEQQQLRPLQPKRQQPTIFDPSCQFPKTPFTDFSHEIFLQQQLPPSIPNEHLIPHHLQQRQTSKAKVVVGCADNVNQQQLQALVDQLFKAAELVETGNSVHARGILARLNHQLSHFGKPLQRAAFYFKEALQLLLNTITAPHYDRPLPSSASPLDVVFKISAYKVFSEISPCLQFVNFTSNQAFLEALDGSDRIHIIDFDIGIGGQWASFMQELAIRRGGISSLKISAFASMSSHHPLELELTKENLIHFANDLNILFKFRTIDLDAIDLSTVLSLQSILNLSDGEAVAVNFPVGSSNLPIALLLRLVKQVSPKIVVSIDHGCERSNLPFSQHILHALQSYSVLFDSLDAVNVNSDAICKIEKFLLQPRIESAVLGRHRAGEKMPPWRTLFASAGFLPLAFSNFTKTQVEYMMRRPQVRGFHVEKCQASLYLCWQHRELISISAWRS